MIEKTGKGRIAKTGGFVTSLSDVQEREKLYIGKTS